MRLHEICSSRNGESKASNVSAGKIQTKFDATSDAYPTAPHDSVNSITRIDGSVLNFSITPCLSLCGTFPSNRMLGMEARSSPALMSSRVSLQVEKTMLNLVSARRGLNSMRIRASMLTI